MPLVTEGPFPMLLLGCTSLTRLRFWRLQISKKGRKSDVQRVCQDAVRARSIVSLPECRLDLYPYSALDLVRCTEYDDHVELARMTKELSLLCCTARVPDGWCTNKQVRCRLEAIWLTNHPTSRVEAHFCELGISVRSVPYHAGKVCFAGSLSPTQ